MFFIPLLKEICCKEDIATLCILSWYRTINFTCKVYLFGKNLDFNWYLTINFRSLFLLLFVGKLIFLVRESTPNLYTFKQELMNLVSWVTELKMLGSTPRKWNNCNLNLLLVFHVEHIVLLPLQNHVKTMVACQLGDFGFGDRTRSVSQKKKPSSSYLVYLRSQFVCLCYSMQGSNYPRLFWGAFSPSTVLFFLENELLWRYLCFSCKYITSVLCGPSGA